MSEAKPSTPKSRKDRLLQDFRVFLDFMAGAYGLLAGLSVVFPLSNSLLKLLWTPAPGLFATSSSLACLFTILAIFVNRADLRRLYDPHEELRRGYLLSWDRVATKLRRMLISGVLWGLIGLTSLISYYGMSVYLDRETIALTLTGVQHASFLLLYVAIFVSWTAGFTLLALREFLHQLAVEGEVLTSQPTLSGAEVSGAAAADLPIEVVREVQGRFSPFLEKCFYKEVEVSIEHEVVQEAGLELLRNHLSVKMQIEPCPRPDEWRFTVFGEPLLAEILKRAGSSMELYQVRRVARDGVPLEPVEAEEHGWRIKRYPSMIAPGSGPLFEAEYSYLSFMEDLYYFHLSRLARRIRVMVRKNPKLHYSDPVRTGALIPLKPATKGPFKDVISIEESGLLLPGWGVIIHWRPQTT